MGDNQERLDGSLAASASELSFIYGAIKQAAAGQVGATMRAPVASAGQWTTKKAFLNILEILLLSYTIGQRLP